MRAKINNKIFTVEIKDANYNDHAVEVQILDGIYAGQWCIVEKKDLIKPTVAKILTVAKNEIKAENITSEDLEKHSICELLGETYKYIVDSANDLVNISQREWNNTFHSVYNTCSTLIDTKIDILYRVIENEVIGIHTTIKQEKQKMINNIMGE